jgi:hypothetical protein
LLRGPSKVIAGLAQDMNVYSEKEEEYDGKLSKKGQ